MKQTTLLTWSLLVFLWASFASAKAGTLIPSAVSCRTLPDGRSECAIRHAILSCEENLARHIEDSKNHIRSADEALFCSHYVGIIAGCVGLLGL